MSNYCNKIDKLIIQYFLVIMISEFNVDTPYIVIKLNTRKA